MTYNCIISKNKNKFFAVFPDFPKIPAASSSTQEKALELAKIKLNKYLEAEVGQRNSVPLPVCNDGHPLRIASHIIVAIQLRKLRGSRTQRDIAKKLGFSYQAYQKLENPRISNPTVKTLEKVARVFERELSVQIG